MSQSLIIVLLSGDKLVPELWATLKTCSLVLLQAEVCRARWGPVSSWSRLKENAAFSGQPMASGARILCVYSVSTLRMRVRLSWLFRDVWRRAPVDKKLYRPLAGWEWGRRIRQDWCVCVCVCWCKNSLWRTMWKRKGRWSILCLFFLFLFSPHFFFCCKHVTVTHPVASLTHPSVEPLFISTVCILWHL